jgi:hypothetical protein
MAENDQTETRLRNSFKKVEALEQEVQRLKKNRLTTSKTQTLENILKDVEKLSVFMTKDM